MGLVASLCQGFLLSLVVALIAIYFGTFFFHGPSCPLPEDIQTDYVKANFDIHKFQGVWFEAAYHDWTQPSSVCGCERSVKHYRPDSNHIFDNFTLHCAGDHYFANLTFELRGDRKSHMVGHWNLPLIRLIDFPNTVVAVEVDEETGEYNWVIEYQCVQVFKRVLFAGINFYHKKRLVPDTELEHMIDIAREQGIGYWMDQGLGLYKVNHTECTYPPVDKTVARKLNIDHSNA